MIRPLRLLAAALCLALVSSVSAQPKVTRIIVAFSPGGPVDLVARAISEQLGRELGRTVVVDYKPGANGAIGAQEVMRAEADGGTLWLTSVGAAAINPVLYEKLPYSMQRDFAPVSLVVNNDELLATSPSYPAKDAAEFVAAAKKRAEPTPMASSGIGSIPHLAIEQLEDATGAKLLHVPYKGAAPALTALQGGEIESAFVPAGNVVELQRAGRVKVLAVTGRTRSPMLPDVPTFDEGELALKAMQDASLWYGFFAPARSTPADVERLSAALARALANPEVASRVSKLDVAVAHLPPADFARVVRRDAEQWGAVIRASGFTLSD